MPERRTRFGAGFVTIAILLAAALRFGGLAREPLWSDETLTARAAKLSLSSIVTEAVAWEHNPPLYAMLMHAWVSIAGDSATALRIPAALFGLLTVIVIYLIGRRLGSETFARVGLALGAVWPILVVYSQEARTYSLYTLLTALSYLFFVRVVEKPTKTRDVVAYALATALCLYSHNQALFVVAAQGATAAWTAYRLRRNLNAWLLAVAIAAFVYAPWIPTLLSQMRRIASWKEWWLPAPSPGHLLWSYYHFVTFVPDYPLESSALTWIPRGSGIPLLTVALALAVGALIIAGVAGRRRAELRPGGVALLASWCVLPSAIAFAVSHVSTPIFLPRFQLATVPAVVLLTALGVVALARSERRIALVVGAIVLAQAVGLVHYYRTPTKERWDHVVRILSEEGRHGDLIILSSDFIRTPFAYHYRGALPVVEVQDFDEPFPVSLELLEILPRFRRVWLVEAYSGRNTAVRALEVLHPRGPARSYTPRGIRVSLYELPP